MAATGSGAWLNCGSFRRANMCRFQLPTPFHVNPRAAPEGRAKPAAKGEWRVENGNAFLPQSNHRCPCFARPDLARDLVSAYHLSRVTDSNESRGAKACGQDARASAHGIAAIVGPTASGKSELGIELALR